MSLPLEAVPNFSEGRSEATIAALREALARHAHVLDLHVDADHNRSVFTIAGPEPTLVDALVDAIACARERIGEHVGRPLRSSLIRGPMLHRLPQHDILWKGRVYRAR